MHFCQEVAAVKCIGEICRELQFALLADSVVRSSCPISRNHAYIVVSHVDAPNDVAPRRHQVAQNSATEQRPRGGGACERVEGKDSYASAEPRTRSRN